eukprot:SAG22_NODE_868_length_6763_cov_110.776261_3_plen_48_part_00
MIRETSYGSPLVLSTKDVGQARSDLAKVAFARVIFISEPDADADLMK